MSKKKIKITDLVQDNKNFNKGTDIGASILEKSIEKFGAGRSVLIDKNNRLIAGNKSTQKMIESGIKDLVIVESDGSKLIAVKRTDIDLDTPEGREMALADNASARANIVFDLDVVEAELGETVVKEYHVADMTNSIDESVVMSEVIEVPEEELEKREVVDDFEEKFNKYNDENCKLPIVPDFFETHECFLIPIDNEIDEKFIRDIFDLNEKHVAKSKDGKIIKTNVISIEKLKKWASK